MLARLLVVTVCVFCLSPAQAGSKPLKLFVDIDTPYVHVGDVVDISLAIGPLKSEDIKQGLAANQGVKIKKSIFERSQHPNFMTHDFKVTFSEIGRQTIGPFELNINGEAWRSESLSLMVVDKVPLDYVIISTSTTSSPQGILYTSVKLQVKTEQFIDAIDLSLQPMANVVFKAVNNSTALRYVGDQPQQQKALSFDVYCDAGKVELNRDWFAQLPVAIDLTPVQIECE